MLGKPPHTHCLHRSLVLTLALGLSACQPAPEPPLRLGSFGAWPGYEPFYLAEELGFYDGAAVKLADYTSATAMLQAFRNGALDAATLTLDEVLLLADQGHDPRIALVLDTSHGADAILGRPGLKTLADLRGRRVAAEASALAAYMLSRGLENGGLTAADVTLVPVEADEFEEVFAAGRVDALVCYEPHKSHLLAQGAELLFDSSRIPREIFDVLLVRASAMERHGRSLLAVGRGWFRALDYIRARPDDAYERIGKRLKLSPAEARRAFAGLTLTDLPENKRLLLSEQPAILGPARELAGLMLKKRLVAEPVEPARFLDPRLLARLGR